MDGRYRGFFNVPLAVPMVSFSEKRRPDQHIISMPAVYPWLHLRYSGVGISRDPAEPELFGRLFLLAGKKALEELRTVIGRGCAQSARGVPRKTSRPLCRRARYTSASLRGRARQ